MEKYILITGSNGGIGKSLCEVFKSKKYKIIGTGTKNTSSHKYVDEYIKCDLSEQSEQIDLFTKVNNIISNKYLLSGIIHNAAIQICKPIWEYNNSDITKSFNCNVFFLFLMTQNLIHLFKRDKTTIINISSVHSICSSKNISLYSSTKSCLTGLTRNMAIDLGEFGCRVVSISPGAVNTHMLRDGLSRNNTFEKSYEKLKQSHILNEIGTPEQISTFVYSVFNNTFINGVNLSIDGGISIMLPSE
jgi:NAD(P)-dependent dehydrogenase (short-subunit alcohol dehydrogenase family)